MATYNTEKDIRDALADGKFDGPGGVLDENLLNSAIRSMQVKAGGSPSRQQVEAQAQGIQRQLETHDNRMFMSGGQNYVRTQDYGRVPVNPGETPNQAIARHASALASQSAALAARTPTEQVRSQNIIRAPSGLPTSDISVLYTSPDAIWNAMSRGEITPEQALSLYQANTEVGARLRSSNPEGYQYLQRRAARVAEGVPVPDDMAAFAAGAASLEAARGKAGIVTPTPPPGTVEAPVVPGKSGDETYLKDLFSRQGDEYKVRPAFYDVDEGDGADEQPRFTPEVPLDITPPDSPVAPPIYSGGVTDTQALLGSRDPFRAYTQFRGATEGVPGFNPWMGSWDAYQRSLGRGYQPLRGQYFLSPLEGGEGTWAEYLRRGGGLGTGDELGGGLASRFGDIASMIADPYADYSRSPYQGQWARFFSPEGTGPGGRPLGAAGVASNLADAALAARGGPSAFNEALRNLYTRRFEMFGEMDPTLEKRQALLNYTNWLNRGLGATGDLVPGASMPSTLDYPNVTPRNWMNPGQPDVDQFVPNVRKTSGTMPTEVPVWPPQGQFQTV